MTALEFLEEAIHLQDDYMAVVQSGFYHKKKVIRLLDPYMQKYGMTFEEAEQAARNRLTLRGYYDILKRREDVKQNQSGQQGE